MNDRKVQNKTQQRPMGGPMGGGGPFGGRMMHGEKAKDFKGTMQKMLRYMKKHLVSVIVSFVIAIGSVVLTINIPNILGQATDEIIIGVTKMTVYNGVSQLNDGINELSQMLNAIPPQVLSTLLADKTATLETLAEKGILPKEAFNQMDEQMKKMPLSMIQSVSQQKPQTIGELMNLMEEMAPDSERMTDKIPEKYREEIFKASLSQKPSIDTDAVVSILRLLILLVILSAVLNALQGFIMSGVAQKVSYGLRRDMEQKINKLPLSYFDRIPHGEVLSFITNDIDTISTTLNQSLSQMITSFVTVFGVLYMMLRISWVMTLTAIVMLPLSFGFIAFTIKRSQRHFKDQQKYLGNVNGHIEEMYSGHTVVQLFGGEQKSLEKFEGYNRKLYQSSWKSQFLSGLMMPVMMFIGNLGYVAICVLGGYLTIAGKITVGNIQAFIQYIRQFNQPIGQLATITNTLQSTAAAAERVFGFLEQPEEQETGEKRMENPSGDVQFKDVKFGYIPDQTVITHFSASVKAGQRIAIVGPTGAGKTTIIKLLMRFYDLDEGMILLDDQNIADFKRSDVRNQFGMVLQDTWLFSGSIMENIRYGRPTATDEEVYRAAKTASAHHFIKTLPGGYDFIVNEEGGNISQGQKQLLTIARAVLADPKMLILDEATSSVDTRTELMIQKAMEKLMEGRTSFIIAHRLSTIRDADLILVMRDGDIVEKGTHTELIEQNGFYADLYNSQFEHKDAV